MAEDPSAVSLAIIGAGKVGTAIAVLLRRAGHRIVAVSGREATKERADRYLPGVPLLQADEAATAADIVIIGVPDDAVSSLASSLSGSLEGRWVAHLSGSLGLGALEEPERTGARPFLIHPLQTCPDVERAVQRIPGSAIAVTSRDEEGFRLGERLATAMEGHPFRLNDEMRALYHAAAVFASNYLVANEAIAERLLALAGVPDARAAMMPLVRATVENVDDLGPATALTGPAVRGDAGTIRRNLEALGSQDPDLVATYVQMARASLSLAAAAGRLSGEKLRAVEEELSRWS